MKGKLTGITLVLILVMAFFGMTQVAFADDGSPVKAKRTVLLYACGSNLETEAAMASFNLKQILGSNFSSDDDVKFVIMTGGSKVWKTESEYLCDPNNVGIKKDKKTGKPVISGQYNQLWEAKGADAAENAGKMVLLDADGITGKDGQAVLSKDELMSNPETLKAFINFGVDNYPAEKYDLILWDHGGATIGGFGNDEHDPDEKAMTFAGLVDAFSDNKVTKDGGKFDFIDFDACLQGTIEYCFALADYTDYYIGSPEVEPGYGQNYTGWLNMLGANPEADTFELGKQVVDDFFAFYDSGQGKGQEGTLSIYDLNKLVAPETGFVSAMSEIQGILKEQANNVDATNVLPYYDEFISSNGAISYEGDGTIDLGNLVSLLGVVSSEVSEDQIQDDTMDDTNAYTEAAKTIGAILYQGENSENQIIYTRGTSGIKSAQEQVYRTPGGDLDYDFLGTSGMSIFFPMPSLLFDNAQSYCDAMTPVIEKMPAGDRRDFLTGYRDTAIDYFLIRICGSAVNMLINSQGLDKSKVDYDAVYDFWNDDEGLAFMRDYTLWNMRIKPMLDRKPNGHSEATKKWMAQIIKQQAAEAISHDDVSAVKIKSEDGDAYRVTIKDADKRVIQSVKRNVTAELPALEAYKKSLPADKAKVLNHYKAISLGSIDGYLDLKNSDFPEADPNDPADVYRAIVRWMNAKGSVWGLDALKSQWYAISDSKGNLHVASIYEEDDKTFSVPVFTGDPAEDDMVLLEFEKEDPSSKTGKLKSVAMYDPSTGTRHIPPKELQNELELMPAMILDAVFESYDVPISESTFTLSAENYKGITLEFTDIKDISDIQDVDGDGKALDSTVTITSIYDQEIDVTDKVDKPEAEYIDISLARVKPAICDTADEDLDQMKELVPEITYQGKKLKENVDYTWEKANPEDVFKKPGDYYIVLKGMGKFTNPSSKTFSIVRSEALAEQYVKEAQDLLKEAQKDFDPNNPDSITRYFNAQNALTDAQVELDRTRNILSKEKQAELEEKIADLESQIEDLTKELEAAKVVDISNYNVTMKTSMPYTGKAIKPSVKVSGLNESNYTVTYANNVKIGTATVTIKAKGDRYTGTIKKTFKIVKAANPLKVKGKTASVKVKKLKKKAQTLKASKLYKFSNKGKGKRTYKLLSAKKGSKSFKKYFKVTAKSGKIKVKKGLKKGTYKVKVQVKAKGNTNFKAGKKTVTIKIKVK